MKDNARTDMIEKHCYNCGHNRFIGLKNKCARCKSGPTKLKKYKNKHGKIREKVVKE